MRTEYLFDFARILSISPPEVDALRFWDFIQLVVHLKEYCPAAGGCTMHAPRKKPDNG